MCHRGAGNIEYEGWARISDSWRGLRMILFLTVEPFPLLLIHMRIFFYVPDYAYT